MRKVVLVVNEWKGFMFFTSARKKESNRDSSIWNHFRQLFKPGSSSFSRLHILVLPTMPVPVPVPSRQSPISAAHHHHPIHQLDFHEVSEQPYTILALCQAFEPAFRSSKKSINSHPLQLLLHELISTFQHPPTLTHSHTILHQSTQASSLSAIFAKSSR